MIFIDINHITINELTTFEDYLMKKKLSGTLPEKESNKKNYYQRYKNIIMAVRNVVVFVLYFEGDIKKNNAYDRKPEKTPEHLYFFHYNTVNIVT